MQSSLQVTHIKWMSFVNTRQNWIEFVQTTINLIRNHPTSIVACYLDILLQTYLSYNEPLIVRVNVESPYFYKFRVFNSNEKKITLRCSEQMILYTIHFIEYVKEIQLILLVCFGYFSCICNKLLIIISLFPFRNCFRYWGKIP